MDDSFNFHALYKEKSLREYRNLESLIENKNLLHYINNISTLIFTKAIKFYYCDENNVARHMHMAIDSILTFILYKIANSITLVKNNTNFILQKLVKATYNKNNNNNNKYFSIEMSPDIFRNGYYHYYNNTNQTIKINKDKRKHYKVYCQQTHILRFLGTNCKQMMGYFRSNGDHLIVYIQIENPKIYTPYYCNNNVKIWVIELRQNETLMIVEWPFMDKSVMSPYSHLFEFLRTTNLLNIIDNSVLLENIETFTLPSLNNINSRFSNIQVFLEDAPEFKDIFTKNEKCENFNFINTSHLSVNNFNITFNEDYIIDKLHRNDKRHILIYEPFLYLIFNKDRILKSGGIFDCDTVISSPSFFSPKKTRMKHQNFKELPPITVDNKNIYNKFSYCCNHSSKEMGSHQEH